MRCTRCGEENAATARYCQRCAAPLGETQPAAERKVVSVLFVDLVGFTAQSDMADPEDVQAVLRPYHALLRQEIERFDGTVEKFVGDAVMAVFGAPVAHEDDAERAVRTGLRILEAIAELNEADPDVGLQVRVGIDTGEAVVALAARPEQGEGLVTGDIVNTAARIQSAAPVNGVAVSEQTYRATSRVFEFEHLAPVSVKGKAEPIALWRPKAALVRFGREVNLRYGTPFVGRALEKPLLIGTFERAAQQPSVQLVTVVGEPGVGKSRLIGELFAYIDAKPALIRWPQGVPLLVGCSARPELYERRPGWGAGQRNAHTINLSPLSDQETATLISHLTTTVLGPELERAMVERAGGNPLYAEEFVRLLMDRDLASGETVLPESVQALIAARLDTLSPERKGLLQDAAVLGKVFWAG